MRALSASLLISVWETAESQHPLDRALTLLCAAEPGTSRACCAELPLGERDRRLFMFRAQQFGRRIEAITHCPGCQAAVMFDCDVADLCPTPPQPDPANDAAVAARRLRPPSSADLAAVLALEDPQAAVAELMQRCGGDEATACNAAARDAFSEEIAQLDPQADLTLQLACPSCSRPWDETFDIAAFLWSEISMEARRLLREVDTLARVYGWSEEEILSLSPARRRSYLELATA